MPVERSAGIIFFRNTPKGRKYLLLRSSRDASLIATKKKVKEFWDLPKGILNKGESGIDAARREAKKEVGIDNVSLFPDFKKTVQYFTWRDGKRVMKFAAMFLGESPTDTVTLSWEHDKAEWLLYEDAKARVTLRQMKDALEAAEEFLQKKCGRKAVTGNVAKRSHRA